MSEGEETRLRRSYDRNLGWCRIWAGVGFAVATLWFTFVVEQQVHPLLDNQEGDTETLAQSTDDALVTESNDSGTPSEITVADLVVSSVLLLGLVISFGIATRCRELYRLDDAALVNIELADQEATP